jgi:DNA polymerase III delta prime subunit
MEDSEILQIINEAKYASIGQDTGQGVYLEELSNNPDCLLATYLFRKSGLGFRNNIDWVDRFQTMERRASHLSALMNIEQVKPTKIQDVVYEYTMARLSVFYKIHEKSDEKDKTFDRTRLIEIKNLIDNTLSQPTLPLPKSYLKGVACTDLEEHIFEAGDVLIKDGEFAKNTIKKRVLEYLKNDELKATVIWLKNLQKKQDYSIDDTQMPPNKSKKQSNTSPTAIIFTGPPGTGKTRASLILSKRLLDGKANTNPAALQMEKFPKNDGELLVSNPNFYRVQFHPSFAYEEFVEGLRPEPLNINGKSDVTYLVRPGILKVVAQLACAYLMPEEYGISFYCEYGNKGWRISGNPDVELYRLMKRNGHFKYRGKTVARSGYDTTVTVPEDANPEQQGIYELTWYSENNDGTNFVLFIDEFNRGNPARIFGETLSLIEETKRYGADESSSVTLPYSRKELFLPNNLHIVCAMNLADRSLSHIDQALRRRFKFVYLKPMMSLLDSKEYGKITGRTDLNEDVHTQVISHFDMINKALDKGGIPAENHIGHSYGFKVLGEFYQNNGTINIVNLLCNLWNTELHSLIRDIVGVGRMDRFIKEIDSIASSASQESQLVLDSDLIKKYLCDPNPEDTEFPWKSAS